jgi:hypothetical protein
MNLFYSSNYVYTASNPTESQQTIGSEAANYNPTQIVQSVNEGESWGCPGLDSKNNFFEFQTAIFLETTNNQIYDIEVKRLYDAGYSTQKISWYLQKYRNWPMTMIISAGTYPLICQDKIKNTTDLFMLFPNDSNTYALTSWSLNNTIINRNFLPEMINRCSMVGEIIPRSYKDLQKNKNQLIKDGLSKQIVSSIVSESGYSLIFYTDSDGSIKYSYSLSDGSSWQTSKLSLFGENSTFKGILHCSLFKNKRNHMIHFLGLQDANGNGEYHLCTIAIEESVLLSCFKNDVSADSIKTTQDNIDKKPITLISGNPSDVAVSNIDKRIKIGNARKVKENFVIIKPFVKDNPLSILSSWQDDTPPPMPYDLNENITILHNSHGHVDKVGNIYVYYLNKDGRIESKVSIDGGDTWKIDLSI